MQEIDDKHQREMNELDQDRKTNDATAAFQRKTRAQLRRETRERLAAQHGAEIERTTLSNTVGETFDGLLDEVDNFEADVKIQRNQDLHKARMARMTLRHVLTGDIFSKANKVRSELRMATHQLVKKIGDVEFDLTKTINRNKRDTDEQIQQNRELIRELEREITLTNQDMDEFKEAVADDIEALTISN